MAVQGTPLKKMVKYAIAKGFTDIAVFNEDRKKINGLLLIHLPAGPTALFKLSSLVLSKDLKVSLLMACYVHSSPDKHSYRVVMGCLTSAANVPEGQECTLACRPEQESPNGQLSPREIF